MPGLRRWGSVRLSLPYPNALGCAKHPVSNHFVSLDCAEPSVFFWHPALTSGRGAPAPKKRFSVVGCAMSATGNPLWNVETPLTPQPPNHAIERAASRAEQLLAPAHRKIDHVADDQAVRDIVAGERPLARGVIPVLNLAGG